MTTAELLAALAERRVPALARAISVIENRRPGADALLSAVHTQIGQAHRIGITGPPGAGKSTLTERLVQHYRDRGRSVAVVAVDPTSPFTGGALLGDRIRMESVSLDPNVYIRSMATRGEIGGLATTTREVCDVLDAFGFERIIIETVGVGQSELTIAATADTAVLVLVPESGDGVQVLKAGVMEIADIYAINKADRPGAERLRNEIEVMLGIRRGNAFRHVAAHHRPAVAPSGGRLARMRAAMEAGNRRRCSWRRSRTRACGSWSRPLNVMRSRLRRPASWTGAGRRGWPGTPERWWTGHSGIWSGRRGTGKRLCSRDSRGSPRGRQVRTSWRGRSWRA